ncbi:MAG: hypothetical protein GX647_01460 [Clostridiales bacterium]|jgi:hypothetical protein|nr:hypothetical protein [Clostridiales bacterium]OPZ69344.1 MAG: hypothetical protein BWY81_00467 [Firmicutes bacterium ADurb.Bin467]
MRKTLAFCLVLLLALLGVAHAESAAEEAPLAVLVARLEADGSYSYALLGEGDGTEAFASLAGEGETYEERFAALWEAVSKLNPALSVEGGEDVLSFSLGFGADGSIVQASLGAEAAASLEGKIAFAIVIGSFASANPAVTGECEVYIWDLSGIRKLSGEPAEGVAMGLCPNCGGIDDGSAEHDEVISKFCKEGHTKCMDDPEHYCDPDDGGCGRTYPCSKSNSHTKCIKCGKLWCYKKHGDHKELACGHRGCEVYGEEEKHAKCPACGGYLCDGKDHTLAACGKHHLGAQGNHAKATCGIDGHFNCDGKDHSGAAPCGISGHLICDGLDHSEASCEIDGHYNCDGKDHTKLDCGHYVCVDGPHALVQAPCNLPGHYVCVGVHDQAICGVQGHYVCDNRFHDLIICNLPSPPV